MTTDQPLDLTNSPYTHQRVLVTGATSGLGFEAAAQLAELGYGSITITGRTDTKAETAATELRNRTGRDVFKTLGVDVASVASSKQAATELIERGDAFDVLLLNAGMVASARNLTDEGIEVTFGSSVVGHHVITNDLIDAGLLRPHARVVLVGSEAANADLPKAMGLRVAPFALNPPTDEATFAATIKDLARGDFGQFDGNIQYATTKVVSAWWSAEMQRRHGAYEFFTVSPGANVGTNAARNTTGAFKVMVKVMAKVGHLVGMNQPIPVGARRYVDVIVGGSDFEPGATYTSRPKKMVGDLVRRDEPHLVDPVRQKAAVAALDELVAEVEATVV